jgi:hypothetical protein
MCADKTSERSIVGHGEFEVTVSDYDVKHFGLEYDINSFLFRGRKGLPDSKVGVLSRVLAFQ